MDSPYIRNNYKKKNTQSNTSITETRTLSPSENIENIRNTESNKKNNKKWFYIRKQSSR